jgi:alpha-aminoadipic semialdehyde synthase
MRASFGSLSPLRNGTMSCCIGLRREDKNPWERRVPLIPSHIRELREEHGLEFVVQPSAIRVFRDEDFVREGARVQEDLSACPVVLAVKELPDGFLATGRTYLFFSHTIKGQAQNMPMLRRIMDLGSTLIDYERIVDGQGKRLLFFGKQAGEAGMVDTLWALGQRLRLEGLDTPLSKLLQMYHYTNLVEAKEAVIRAAQGIRERGLPADLVPFVAGFLGYGHVSQGAQEVYNLLPMSEVPCHEFASFMKRGVFSSRLVYKIVFHEHHLVRPKDPGSLFDLQEYYGHPDLYEPILEPYLRHLTVLLNGIYWTPRFPHFVSKAGLRRLFEAEAQPRLRVIGDISCDLEGGVECTLRATDSQNPVYVYDPFTEAARTGFEGRGPVVMAVDNLPAEIALESSIFFSQALKPLVPALARADFGRDLEDAGLPPEIQRAVIVYRGRLTPSYAYLKEHLE